MSSKTFHTLHDFVRHGMNIHLTCDNPPCPHTAILDAFMVCQWARLWRWPMAIEADVMRHFRCSKCGARRPHPRPTEQAVTLLNFFPDERGWKRLQQRMRG
ncbi:hypothetical protein Q5H91_04240 [Sphingomonas sp. KR1UV-12]|uniref:Uncharacterized protein n=1 Tax=Sphingomonas aurea TaxID=3063994 RepID=A0ABT9EHF7_9SPHN|nr:hypothetical protein [Sphingomonas sp. KR1UV-12]MDP1026412.1 hypothetical protein [Sphingomonas sp. KR1UV-12]